MGWQDDPLLATAEAAPAGPWAKDPVVGAPAPAPSSQQPRVADNLIDSIRAGLQSSATGLIARGRKPDVAVGESTPWYDRLAATTASTIADLPEMAAGAVAGSEVPVVGTVAGAFAVPMALRSALMTAYSQPSGPRSWGQLWDIAKEGVIGGVKGAVIGKVTSLAGGAAGTLTEGASPLIAGGAEALATSTAMATAGSLLDGHMPHAQDFLDAAIMVGGLKLAGVTAGRLRNIYEQTGIPPEQVALDTIKNPAIKDQIIASDGLPKEYEPIAQAETVRAALPDIEKAKQFLADPFKGGKSPINLDYVDTPEKVKAVFGTLGDIERQRIEEQRRGTVSWDQSYAEAVGKAADILGPRAAGQATDAADIVARGAGAITSAQDLTARTEKLQEAIKAGTATDQMRADWFAAYNRSATLLAEFDGASAEASRALNIHKSFKQYGTQIDAMRAGLEAAGGTQNIDEMVSAFGGATTPEAMLARVRKASQMDHPILRGLGEIWKAGLLSGPKTYMVKAIGDAVNVISTLAEKTVAAGLGVLHEGEKVTPDEIAAHVTGMRNGSADALKIAAAVWKGEQTDSPFEHRAVIGGTPGKILAIPHKIMGAETDFFRVLNERGELNALAVRQAITEKLEHGTDAYNQRVATLLQNPPDEMAKAAEQAGLEGTYTNELGDFGKKMQAFSRGAYTQFILPFSRVPANLVSWAVKRMPGAAMMFQQVRDDLAAGGARRDIAIARQVVGATVATAAYAAVQSGILTGGGEAMTPAERSSKIAAGWQPYSLKLGDKWYSYNRFDPMARVAGIAADLAEVSERVQGDDKASLPALGAAMFGHALVSQTYLSGVNDLLQALNDPEREAPKVFDSFVGSFVPAIVAQPTIAADPYKRRVDSVFDVVKSRLPGLREELLPQINPLTGKPKENNQTLTPVSVSTISNDPVLKEADRLGVNVPKAPKNVHIAGIKGKEGNVEITPEQQNAYAETQGSVAYQTIDRIMQQGGYTDLPDRVKAEIFQKVITLSRKQASYAALPPEARMAEVGRITQEMADKHGL